MEKKIPLEEVVKWYCGNQHDCFMEGLEQIEKALNSVECRGMIISGKSFIGKSVIARQIFYEACRKFNCSDPVFFNQSEFKLMPGDDMKPFLRKAIYSRVVLWDDLTGESLKSYGVPFDPFRTFLELNKNKSSNSFAIFTTNMDMEQFIQSLIEDGTIESNSPDHMINRIAFEYSTYNMVENKKDFLG